MKPAFVRTGVVAALVAGLWISAGQGRGDVREFNVNGFCLKVDISPESYKYYPRAAELNAGPVFDIELGDYSALKVGEEEWRGGQKIGERLTMPLRVMKSSTGPSPEELIQNIDRNRMSCETKSYKAGLVELVDGEGSRCTIGINTRHYIVGDTALQDRAISILCSDYDRVNCRMTVYVGTGWQLQMPFPEQYIEFWPDIRSRMRNLFDAHLDDC